MVIEYKKFLPSFSVSQMKTKTKIPPLKSIIYQGVAKFLSQIKSIGLYELQESGF